MATLKEVQSKIVSVKKTKQITSAMKMVATSRLRGAQTSMEAFKPYADKFAEVLGSIAGGAGGDASPLLVPKEDVKKVAIIVCTSDRGLCGGFNVNLTSKAEKIIKSDLEGKDVSFTCFGKKARDWAKKQPQPIDDEFIGVVGGSVEFSVASSSGQKLINGFLEGDIDEVYLIYSQFENMAKQVPTIKQILPIPSLEGVVSEDEEKIDDDPEQHPGALHALGLPHAGAFHRRDQNPPVRHPGLECHHDDTDEEKGKANRMNNDNKTHHGREDI